MAYKRKETLREIILLQDSIGTYFGDRGESHAAIVRTWTPPVDLFETEDEVFLTADLPGVDRHDLKLEIHDTFITLQGQRRLQKKEGEEFVRVERNYGPFQRTFRLPAPVLEDEVKADFKGGVLKVRLKKDKRPGPEYTVVKIRI